VVLVPSCAGGGVSLAGGVAGGGVIVSDAGVAAGVGWSVLSPEVLQALNDNAPTAASAKRAWRMVLFISFLIPRVDDTADRRCVHPPAPPRESARAAMNTGTHAARGETFN
jgi:hypothetical protein